MYTPVSVGYQVISVSSYRFPRVKSLSSRLEIAQWPWVPAATVPEVESRTAKMDMANIEVEGKVVLSLLILSSMNGERRKDREKSILPDLFMKSKTITTESWPHGTE
jgi:hypothetical protein